MDGNLAYSYRLRLPHYTYVIGSWSTITNLLPIDSPLAYLLFNKKSQDTVRISSTFVFAEIYSSVYIITHFEAEYWVNHCEMLQHHLRESRTGNKRSVSVMSCFISILHFYSADQMMKKPVSALNNRRPVTQYAKMAATMGGNPRYKV